MKLHIAEEFSPYPHGRYEKDGKFNGAAFRDILARRFAEAQAKGERLEIILDRMSWPGGSFSNEAFGKFAKQLLDEQGKKITEDDLYIHGDMPHYELYAAKIWQIINRQYTADKKANAA